MAIKFLNSIESITLPGTTTDYYIGGSGGGVASNALKIGSRTTNNTIAMELFHALNPVSLGISYSGGDALAFIDSVHSSFDSVLQFKTGGDERFRVGALNANTFQIKPASAGNDVSITDNSGNAILYSDTSTQRIGIGTTSPSSKLQVSANDGDGITLQHGASNAFYILRSGNDDTIIKQTRNYTSKISISTLADSGTHESSGLNIVGQGVGLKSNIGIGTDSPSEKLHVDGNLRVTGAYYDSNNAPGTLDQVLTSTATGVAWVDPSTITAEAATLVVIECKNTSGATIAKGTPVYQTGTVGATDVIEIAPADALISSGSQPAIGLLQTTLNNNGFGKVVITGEFLNFTTDPIDGVTPTTGDKVFLKSGGGLTLTKPTGAENGIQNLGLIGKVSGGNAGSITVSSIMRTNDVPNLPTGKIWVGDGNTIVSDTVFLDEPNGRMGIGTTSPTKLLEVKSSSAYDSTVRLSTIAHNWDIQGGEPGYSSTAFALDYDGTTFFRAMGATDARFSGGLSVGTVNAAPPTGGLYVAGNVGIGTTSPTKKLEVMGELVVNSGFNTGVSSLYLSHTDNSGQHKAGIFTTYTTGYGRSSSMQFALNDQMTGAVVTTADAKMTILEGGNVGIGTASPGQKLQVSGNILATGNITAYGGASDSSVLSTSGTLQLRNSGNTNVNIQSNGISYFNGGNVGIGTTSPNYNLDIENASSGAGIRLKRADTGDSLVLLEGASYGYLQNTTGPLGLGGANGDRDVLIDSNGNVGIGATSPSEKLDVEGNIRVGVNNGFYITNQNVGIKRVANDLVVGGFGGIRFTSSSTTVPNQAERMRITSSGNVGIGTTSPITSLHVKSTSAGSGYMTIENTVHYSKLDLKSTTYTGSIIMDGTGGYISGGGLIFDSGTNIRTQFLQGGVAKMIINNGNVGIGTTSPSQKLTVEGNIELGTGGYIYGDTTTPSLRLSNAVGAVLSYGTSQLQNGGSLQFVTTAGTKFRINANGGGYVVGNFGIDTTIPSEKLEVSGNIKLSSIGTGNSANSYGMLFYGTTSSGTQTDQAKIHSSPWATNSNGGNLQLYTSNASNALTERMRIDGAGNVGIGTTAPSTPLHINADAPTIRLQDATSGDNHYLTGNNGELRVQSSGYITMRPGATVSTTFLANGNVGIGTTSPDYPLHVDDTIKIGDRQGTDGSLILQSQQGPNITFKSTGDILDISGTTGATNGNSIRLSDNIKKLYFNGGIGGTIAINRGNRGLMDSNVGGLEVQQQDTASSNGKSTFLSTSSSGTILRSTSYGSTGTSGDIQFQFGGGANTSEPSPTTKMIIKNSGNVGIGTASPSEKLDVVGKMKISDDIILAQTNGRIDYDNGVSSGALRFFSTSGNTERMRITSAGHLLVNKTSSTGDIFQVQGNNNVYASRLDGSATVGQSYGLRVRAGTNSVDTSMLIENTGGTDLFIIKGTGDTGIGVTTPRAKLDVAGGIKVADDTDTAGANKVGTLRYRTSGNNSYVDMCMQTGATTYAWINVVQNNW